MPRSTTARLASWPSTTRPRTGESNGEREIVVVTKINAYFCVCKRELLRHSGPPIFCLDFFSLLNHATLCSAQFYRYIVQLDDGEQLSVRPQNLQQLVPGVVLTGLSDGDASEGPSLNGKSGVLLKFDANKERYNVRLTAVRRTVAVKPENIVLPAGIVVTIRGEFIE